MSNLKPPRPHQAAPFVRAKPLALGADADFAMQDVLNRAKEHFAETTMPFVRKLDRFVGRAPDGRTVQLEYLDAHRNEIRKALEGEGWLVSFADDGTISVELPSGLAWEVMRVSLPTKREMLPLGWVPFAVQDGSLFLRRSHRVAPDLLLLNPNPDGNV